MTNYAVDFYKLIDYGGRLESDGTIIVGDYDEEFLTESYDEAKAEFEQRKKEVTRDNMLGVTLSTWVDDVEVKQENYSSETIQDEEQLEKFMKTGKW